MKKNNILWAVLPMMAAALMTTACGSDDDAVNEVPAAQQTVKTIPYTITVGGSYTDTRATVDDDNRTLRFADGDWLYVTGENVYGVFFNLREGIGQTTAVFDGELVYTGEGTPANDLMLTATLASGPQRGAGPDLISVHLDGSVTVNYPSTAYCADISEAVKKYSDLKGTFAYGDRALSLSQHTTFLNFEITLWGGSDAVKPYPVEVVNNGVTVCTADVTPTMHNDGYMIAKFVLPIPSSTVLNNAKLKMAGKEASFGSNSKELEGKVYNVKREISATARGASQALPEDLGKLLGGDGLIYATRKFLEHAGVSAEGMIAYVGSETGDDNHNHCLAIALKNDQHPNLHQYVMSYDFADKVCKQKTAPSRRWFLPSKDNWLNMFKAFGGEVQDDRVEWNPLHNAIKEVGGDGFLSAIYWSSSRVEPDEPDDPNYDDYWAINFNTDRIIELYSKGEAATRPCIAF